MPGGNPWRDVETHIDPGTGKTFAYVGGQQNADLFVIDLSTLSKSSAHEVDSDPIPSTAINLISGALIKRTPFLSVVAFSF